MNAGLGSDIGRAAAYLGRVNLEIIKAAAGRRQGVGRGRGDRPPAALAAAPVSLGVVGAAGGNTGTPRGSRTAKRKLPRLLSDLPDGDPRVQVAQMLADAVERVGSVRGVDLEGTDRKSVFSDGGATTRLKHAERLRRIKCAVNGWPYRAAVAGGRIEPMPCPRVALAVKKVGGIRQEIKAFEALVAICVGGETMADVLARHGWSPQWENTRRLRAALLSALWDAGVALGVCGGPSPESA